MKLYDKSMPLTIWSRKTKLLYYSFINEMEKENNRLKNHCVSTSILTLEKTYLHRVSAFFIFDVGISKNEVKKTNVRICFMMTNSIVLQTWISTIFLPTFSMRFIKRIVHVKKEKKKKRFSSRYLLNHEINK